METKEKELQARLAAIELTLLALVAATPDLKPIVVEGLTNLRQAFIDAGTDIAHPLFDMLTRRPAP